MNPYYISDADITLTDKQKEMLSMLIAVFGDGQGSCSPENVIHYNIAYVKDILIKNELLDSLKKQTKENQTLYGELKEIFDKL